MSFVDRMLAKSGKTRNDFPMSTVVGKSLRRSGVASSPDFLRIRALPRRDWRDGIEGFTLDQICDYLTEKYARAPSKDCDERCVCLGAGFMRLKPVQAAALVNMHDCRGLFAPIGVGGGKTLVSFLGPAVCEAERPLVMVPANLRDKTNNDWLKLSKHWKLPPVRVESYERFGVVKNKFLFDQIRPDWIFADEGHKLKNPKAAVTARLKKYLKPNKPFFSVATGTSVVSSLRDFWHLLRWTIGDQLCPIPVDWQEMMSWCECIDVSSKSAIRLSAGVLSEFADGSSTIEDVRNAIGIRIIQTPGVVCNLGKNEVEASLLITALDVNLDHLGEKYERLRGDMETPDGWSFSERSQLWAHAREFACGFYYVWDPRPPDDWMFARKRWHQFVRGVLKHSQKFETELEVGLAASKGQISTIVEEVNFQTFKVENIDVYKRWVAIRDTFKPNSVPKWIDDTTLNLAAKWIKKHDSVVWVEHPCFGERLAKMVNVPYYGRGGYADNGTYIENHPTNKAAVVSVLANGTGKNLQGIWSHALVVSAPPNGKVTEQLLGRLHRPGQKADQVHFEFLSACREHVEGFEKVTLEAALIQSLQREEQKWNFADRMIPSVEDLESKTNPRWQQNR